MALLELIRGLQTSDDTHAKAEAFSKRIGKVSITAKNSPGFASTASSADDQRGDLSRFRKASPRRKTSMPA